MTHVHRAEDLTRPFIRYRSRPCLGCGLPWISLSILKIVCTKPGHKHYLDLCGRSSGVECLQVLLPLFGPITYELEVTSQAGMAKQSDIKEVDSFVHANGRWMSRATNNTTGSPRIQVRGPFYN